MNNHTFNIQKLIDDVYTVPQIPITKQYVFDERLIKLLQQSPICWDIWGEYDFRKKSIIFV